MSNPTEKPNEKPKKPNEPPRIKLADRLKKIQRFVDANQKKILLTLITAFLLVILGSAAFIFYTQSQVKKALEPSVSETKIAALANIREVNLVTELGAIPNDDKDDSAAFQQALNLAKEEPIHLIIPEGEYLSKPSGNLEATEIKGLHIEGQGTVNIKPVNPMINPPEYYFMRINMAAENLGVEIENIVIDGSLSPQDLYFTMQTPADVHKTPLQRGIFINGAKDLAVHNTTFQHMYGGYTIHATNYENVNIKDITINDVGGDDITDSFGMALYFGGHAGNAVINVDNVQAQGKVSERNPSYTAWIGIVLENGTIQAKDDDDWKKDQNTTVNVTNSSFMDYETTFHIESMAGNVYWNVDNVKTRAKDYLIAAGINGEMKERTNRLTMEMTPWGRNNIIHGLYYTEKEAEDNVSGVNEFSMYNSEITYLTLPDTKPISVATSYADSVRATYTRTTFNDVPAKLVANASATFIKSQINLAENSKETAASLLKGSFSKPEEQFIKFDSTKINKFPTAKKATKFGYPKLLEPTGYTPPPIDKSLPPAELKE